MAKILLVEDDNNLREIYEARLQAEGYDVVAASDGEEALVVAKNEQPDLVISDVMMPKISGFEMLDIMRNTPELKNVKVIMLTALGQAEDQTRANDLGADRYLVKSQVTLEDIVTVAQDLLVKAGAIADPASPAAATETAAAPAPAAVAVPAEPATDVPTAAAAAVPAATTTTTPAAAAAPEPMTPEPSATPEPAMPVAEPPVAIEPSAAPEPATAVPTEPAAPIADPSPAAEPVVAESQTSAQEEQAVQAQIDNFVDTQSGDAPAEVAAPAAPSSAAEPEVTTPETAAPANTTTPEQQQALDAAVSTLNQGDAGAEDATEATADGGVAHKKVIKPLDDPQAAKKNIHELLAEEEAKQIINPDTAAPQVAAPASEVKPTEQKPANAAAAKPAQGLDDFDPNSIAL